MDPAAQLRRQSSGPIARGSSTRQRATLVLPPSSARGANADASQYFSIETRLELKARLAKLQLQLRQLLVQSKLAWMRCFAESDTPGSGRGAALQMVQLGEALTANLSRGFDLAAGTATAPLSEYQALVTQVEAEMAKFQHLVTNVAYGNYPRAQFQQLATNRTDEDDDDYDDDNDDSANEDEDQNCEQQDGVVTYLNCPMTVDLPSMQTYCKYVAPPYSSYLPKNKMAAATGKKRVV
ncbi:unnamed protein product [Phytophthora lilii]|uniref:Unnamed protein product n=1 Tax=Phytophthora lilii TaxID=2077276 RepID=A0A9W6WF60_9STRA|nr:unnamed protein product [Phytophthora lilii]